MARTLSERLRAHEQSKARLAEAEAKLKLDERKQRTRRLVEAAPWSRSAACWNWTATPSTVPCCPSATAPTIRLQVEKWAALGGRTFAREAKARDEGKEAVLLTFTAPLPKDATTALRKAGFRYSKVMQHWEGLARSDDADALAKAHGGTARRVGGTASGSTAAEAGEAAA